ncbi:armadillo-type protein [Phlyctochytrium arcticum]|nr:armadillo-type protein [Phlyctochytrium arcticum]
MSVEQVEQAIHQLYDPQTPNEEKKIIEGWLQHMQKEPSAWGIASQLLRSQSSYSQFFGALTFQIKIARDWFTLSGEQLPQLRDELLSGLLRSTGGTSFVTTKLCVALVQCALRDESGQWDNFITSASQAIEGQMQQAGSQDEGVAVQHLILEFLTIVPEEVRKADLTPSRKAKVQQEVNEATDAAIRRILYVLSPDLASCGTTESAITDLQQKALRCLQSWVQYDVPIGSMREMMTKVIALIPNPETFEPAIDTLIELITHRGIKAYSQSILDTMLNTLTIGWIPAELKRAINEQDEDAARPICRLMVEFGESFYGNLITHIHQEQMRTYLDMMLACTGFPGYFGPEQTLSELPVTFWALFQEELEGTGILQGGSLQDVSSILTHSVTRQPVMFGNGNDMAGAATHLGLDVVNISPGTKLNRNETAAITTTAAQVFARLVDIVREKLQFPPEAVWNCWTADVKDAFLVYRRDCSEVLLACYSILREDMTAYLIPLVISKFDAVKVGAASPEDLESILFSIKSISDAVDPCDEQIARLFGDEFLGKLSSTPPEKYSRVKSTMARLIGSYASWLDLNSHQLGLALQYLILSVQYGVNVSSAVHSLLVVCDVCRDKLVDGIDMLVDVWELCGPRLKPTDKSRLVKAVTNVIQRVPYAHMLPRLLKVLGVIIGDLKIAIEAAAENIEESKENVLHQYGYLKACCQGIQQPEVDLDGSEESLAGTCPPPSAGSADPQLQNVAAVIWEVTQRTCTLFGADEDVVQALTSFINETLRSVLPIFTPNLPALVNLLIQLFAQHPHACLLDSAGATATAYGDGQTGRAKDDERQQLQRLLIDISNVVLRFLPSGEGMAQYPDVVCSYFGLLTRYTTNCPWALTSLPPDLFHRVITQLALPGFYLQDTFAATEIFRFLTDFISQDFESSELAPLIRGTIQSLGQNLVNCIIDAIAGRQPLSMDHKISDVMYKLVIKYPEATRGWLVASLSLPNPMIARVTEAEKAKFVKNIAGSRLLKRTKDAVKQFALECRGLANTAFGKAI